MSLMSIAANLKCMCSNKILRGTVPNTNDSRNPCFILNPTERLPWYHTYLVSSREVTSPSLCFPKLSYSIVVLLWEDISFLVHPPEPSHHHFVWSSVSQRFYIVNICLASSHQYKNLQNAKMIIILMVIAVWKVTLVINCF